MTQLIENPTGDPLALFLIQVLVIISLVRLLGRLLIKIRQPMVIGEIIAGILLGPSAFGQIPGFTTTIFPADSLGSLKLFANIGLIFFMFFLGLEVDINQMRKSLKQSIPIAVASIICPFAVGAVLAMWFYDLEPNDASFISFLLFLGTALSFTAFPVLARVLTSARLLASPVGGQALGCAAVDDLLAWCTLALTLSYSSGGGPLNGLYVALISCGLILFLVFVIRPGLEKYHRYLISIDDELNRNFLALLFLLLCLTAWFAQILGIEAFCGSFIFGIMVPKGGTLVDNLAPKIELLIVEFFLPLYFANSGIRTNIGGLDKGVYWGAFFVVCAVGSVAKILPVTLVARSNVRLNRNGGLFNETEEVAGGDDYVPALHTVEPIDKGVPMPWKQCFTIGILMNTRGLVGLIVLNIGLSSGILGTKVFTIMVLFSLVTTFITPPALYSLYGKEYHTRLDERVRMAEAALAKRGHVPLDAPGDRSMDDEQVGINGVGVVMRAQLHERSTDGDIVFPNGSVVHRPLGVSADFPLSTTDKLTHSSSAKKSVLLQHTEEHAHPALQSTLHTQGGEGETVSQEVEALALDVVTETDEGNVPILRQSLKEDADAHAQQHSEAKHLPDDADAHHSSDANAAYQAPPKSLSPAPLSEEELMRTQLAAFAAVTRVESSADAVINRTGGSKNRSGSKHLPSAAAATDAAHGFALHGSMSNQSSSPMSAAMPIDPAATSISMTDYPHVIRQYRSSNQLPRRPSLHQLHMENDDTEDTQRSLSTRKALEQARLKHAEMEAQIAAVLNPSPLHRVRSDTAGSVQEDTAHMRAHSHQLVHPTPSTLISSSHARPTTGHPPRPPQHAQSFAIASLHAQALHHPPPMHPLTHHTHTHATSASPSASPFPAAAQASPPPTDNTQHSTPLSPSDMPVDPHTRTDESQRERSVSRHDGPVFHIAE